MLTDNTPKAYDPKATEERIYKKWEESGCFQPRGNGKSYAIHLPPPNITGSLHMGHALNATITDILIRYHRMKGEQVVWFPGTDHAGIAAQNVVEKNLKKEGVNRWDLGREKFIEKVWEWKNKYGNIIIEQLKKLGASCDWSRLRFTMDADYADWVKKAFVHYYEKGLIFRGRRTINWCPRCGTSLSDLEVDYKEEDAKLYFIQYGPFVLATVRPETKFGDTALAVHPDDQRYKKYIGKEIEIETLDINGLLDAPVKTKSKIVVVADQAVDPEFGTGVIKVTPAHDITDYEISQRHNLPMTQVIDERGRMNENAGKYAGMKIIEAREKIVADLKATGLLLKEEAYRHNIAVCYRCNAPIEPLPSPQWFVKMEELAKKALDAVKSGKIKIIPENFEKAYFGWLNPPVGGIRDWTISRQIWWGHQLPVYFCKLEAEAQSEKRKVKNELNNFVVAMAKPKQCPFCKECEMEQSPDILDTWFSSALWPFAELSEEDLKKFYPSNVLITARDIINLWVGRMIFSGLEFMDKEPFPEVLIHGTILTKEGKRMSKSLGTGIDPLGLIEKYGADATRFGIIWQAMGNQDVRWDETAVMAGKKFANKIWNISRFVLQKNNTNTQISTNDTNNANLELQVEDKEILEKLEKIKKEVEEGINQYQFGHALHALYDFIWHDFADKYIEASKSREDDAVKNVLARLLADSLTLLHPFMPFITEEIYSQINKEKLLIISQW